jgi:hypothetical protein
MNPAPPTPTEPQPSTFNLQPSTMTDQPSTNHRRKGTVARLPKTIRDQINKLIDDGVTYAAIIKQLGDSGKLLKIGHLSEWKKGGYQDWLKEQQWREDTRAKHEAAADLIDKLDLGKANQAALYVATLQIFDALRNLATTGLNDKLGGDCVSYARLINALSRASKETLALQKHSELRAQAEAEAEAEAQAQAQTADSIALDSNGEPQVNVTNRTRGAILGALDFALGFDKPIRFITDEPSSSASASSSASEVQAKGEDSSPTTNPPIQKLVAPKSDGGGLVAPKSDEGGSINQTNPDPSTQMKNY